MKKLLAILVVLVLLSCSAFAAYRSSTSSSGVSTTPATTVPASVASGDIVILTVNADSPTSTRNWPSGFTEICLGTTTDQRTASAWKRLTGADSGSYTMGTLGASMDWTLSAVAFSGRDATNPPVCGTVTVDNVSRTSPVTLTATGVTALLNDDLLWVGGLDVNSSGIANAWTAPTSYTTRQSPESSPGWSDHSVASRDAVAAGATGNIAGSVTLTSLDTKWASYLIRIPVGGAPPATVLCTMSLMGAGPC